MLDPQVKTLKDLNSFRSAPDLDYEQSDLLRGELMISINNADWFTVGIMASSSTRAIFVLREMEDFFGWPTMHLRQKPNKEGPVFLKANQKTGDVYVRLEEGLGEGVLIGCQFNQNESNAETIGPFPLDFFRVKD